MRLRTIVPSILFASLLSAGTAFAQDPAQPATNPTTPSDPNTPATGAAQGQPATATPAISNVQQDKPKKPDEEEEELKHVTLTANPLSLILTRIGINVEYLPVTHHAFVLNPYFQSNSVESGGGSVTSKSSYTTFGGELGYRFYTGQRGANGFFVGPSVFIQNTAQKTEVTGGTTTANRANAEASTLVYGAILDLGGQHVTKGGFTIGGGVGVMYLVAANEAQGANTSSTVKFSGVLPRFLFTVGYSF